MDLQYIGNWLNGEGAAAYLDGIGSYFGAPGWYYVAQGEPGQLPIVVGTYTAPPAGTPAPAPAATAAAPSATTAAPAASATSASTAAPASASSADPRKKNVQYYGSWQSSPFQTYDEYGPAAGLGWQGAGYYEIPTFYGADGEANQFMTNRDAVYYGALDPNASLNTPTDQGKWEWNPRTQQFDPSGGQVNLIADDLILRGPQGISLGDFYGPAMSRDKFIEQFYTPYANVAGIQHPDEFLRAIMSDAMQEARGVWAGSENKAEAGSASNDAMRTAQLLQEYMNQPALLAARGGQQFNWQDVPQLVDFVQKGHDAAKAVAQRNHDVNTNTSGFLPGLSFMDFLKGISVWAPGLAPGLGGFMQGGLGGALSAIENVGAGQVLGSLGTKALGIVSPQLGQIAGIAQGLNSLPGAFGGSQSLTGMLGLGTNPAALSNGSWDVLPDASYMTAGGYAPGYTGLRLDALSNGSWDVLPDAGAMPRSLSSLDFAEEMLRQAPSNVDSWLSNNTMSLGSAAAGAAGAITSGAGPTGPAPDDYRYEDIGAGAPQGVEKGLSIGQMLGGAQKVLGLAQQISGLLGGGAEQQQSPVPQRRQGQTEEQYQTEVSSWAAEYLDLDVEAMARAGLEPGSPEYMQYILNQADSVIEQIFSHAPEALRNGESIGDLQGALRDLSKSELLQLQRALYVRGALGQIMGSGEYVDPFSGISEQTMGEGMFAPSVAAYQRGMARNVDSLAGLRGNDARTFLDNLMGRNVDIFDLNSMGRAGMLRAQMIAAALENGDLSEEDKKRLLAMQGGLGSATDWAGVINQTGDQFINQLQGDQGALDLYNAIFGGQ